MSRVFEAGTTDPNDFQLSYTWFNASKCKDLYREEIESGNQVLAKEFYDDSWICPDTK